MIQWMDLLRGPALGVVVMIGLSAVVVIITAFAALIAQMALLLRLRPLNTAEKKEGGTGTEPYPQNGRGSFATVQESRSEYLTRRREPQVVAYPPEDSAVIEAVWWEALK